MQQKYLEAKKKRSGRSTTKASLDLACTTLAFLVHFLQIITAVRGALLSPPARLILRFRMEKEDSKRKTTKFSFPTQSKLSRLSRDFPNNSDILPLKFHNKHNYAALLMATWLWGVNLNPVDFVSLVHFLPLELSRGGGRSAPFQPFRYLLY